MSWSSVWRIYRARWQWQPTLTAHDPNPPLPLETPTSGFSGILKRWTGAAWLKETLQTYLGGSWQTKPLKRWTGTVWGTIDTTGV